MTDQELDETIAKIKTDLGKAEINQWGAVVATHRDYSKVDLMRVISEDPSWIQAAQYSSSDIEEDIKDSRKSKESCARREKAARRALLIRARILKELGLEEPQLNIEEDEC